MTLLFLEILFYHSSWHYSSQLNSLQTTASSKYDHEFLDAISSLGLAHFNNDVKENGKYIDFVFSYFEMKNINLTQCVSPLLHASKHHSVLHVAICWDRSQALDTIPQHWFFNFCKADFSKTIDFLLVIDRSVFYVESSIENAV